MALKDVFSAMRREGCVTAPLDSYLYAQAGRPSDRAVDVNAPSQAGGCPRAGYFSRKGFPADAGADPRMQRILDNGTFVHRRLQGYLLDMGMLIMDEVPLVNEEHNIQGHTDGYLDLGGGEVAILEIKSINSRGFARLSDAKEEHKMQGLVYLFCAEERRKALREAYGSEGDFNASYGEREAFYESRYQHLEDGGGRTREEKIEDEVGLNMVSDNVLFHTERPVSKVVFLYECKDTQELKEFRVEGCLATEPILREVLAGYDALNEHCRRGLLPPRPEGATKSGGYCKWCRYRGGCYAE